MTFGNFCKRFGAAVGTCVRAFEAFGQGVQAAYYQAKVFTAKESKVHGAQELANIHSEFADAHIKVMKAAAYFVRHGEKPPDGAQITLASRKKM